MNITEFLKARITEDEAIAQAAISDGEGAIDWAGDSSPTDTHIAHWDPARVLAECKAKRDIIELHDQWPVFIETEPEPLLSHQIDQTESIAFTMVKNIEWATNKAYVERFGTQPPTTPMLIAMANIYADHPDFQEEWRAQLT